MEPCREVIRKLSLQQVAPANLNVRFVHQKFFTSSSQKKKQLSFQGLKCAKSKISLKTNIFPVYWVYFAPVRTSQTANHLTSAADDDDDFNDIDVQVAAVRQLPTIYHRAFTF